MEIDGIEDFKDGNQAETRKILPADGTEASISTEAEKPGLVAAAAASLTLTTRYYYGTTGAAASLRLL